MHAILKLPHSCSGDCQAQETVLAPSAEGRIEKIALNLKIFT